VRTGLHDDYFQDSCRKERLLSVLFLWSLKYDRVGYRQGMHELVGTISYVLDLEVAAWQSSDTSHPLKQCFTEERIEAHLFWLFDEIMRQLVDLYDPVPLNNSPDAVPQIVDFCTRIQGIVKLYLFVLHYYDFDVSRAFLAPNRSRALRLSRGCLHSRTDIWPQMGAAVVGERVPSIP